MNFLRVLLAPALVLATACSRPVSIPAGQAVVVRVVDGDTADVRMGRGTETIRLLGVDTPETVKPDAPVDCFGPEASDRTKHLLVPGTRLRVERDAEARDRYGRLLLYVWRLSDDLFVNESLLADGYARVLSIAPNEAYARRLAAASAAARSAGLGLWSACPPA